MFTKSKFLIKNVFLGASITLFSFSGCSDLNDDYFEFKDKTCEAFDCHGATQLEGYPPVSGVHTKHLDSFILNIDCNTCHNDYSDNEPHKNMNVDYGEKIISFNDNFLGEYDENSNTCSYLSCHDNSNWEELSKLECISCHGYNDEFYLNQENQGKHLKHVDKKSISCLECHEKYEDGELHKNSKIDTDNDSEIDVISIPEFRNIDWSDSNNSCSRVGEYNGCHMSNSPLPKLWY